MILSIDFETRSPVNLKKSGVYRYFEHRLTEIQCAAYAVDDGPVRAWLPGEPCPPAIANAIATGAEISGWNVNFERQAMLAKLAPLHGWPVPHIAQFRDTAAQAAAQALPRALEKAALVLRLPEHKDLEGAKLMKLMAKPRKPRKGEPEQEVYWYEGDIDRLVEYCKQDVVVERDIRRKLQPLSESEMLLWLFDQLINDRGITLDLDLVDDMLAVVEQQSDRLNSQLSRITAGAVEQCTQTERLKDWLRVNGVDAPSLGKTVIEDVLEQDMPYHCRKAILLWQEASLASVRKLQAAKLCVGVDSRARGLLLFHGATSGRWAGQLLQPHNFVRTVDGFNQDQAIDFIRYRDAALLEFVYDHPLYAISNALRGIMTAGTGKELLSGDYVNIEARITAWLANNTAKLEQFRQQDNHPKDKHYEVYSLTAASIYNKDVVDINKDERQAGKVSELALGFGGGVDALAGMAGNYHIDMAGAFDGLWDITGVVERDKIKEAWIETTRKGNNKGGLSEKAWKACKIIVRAWRRANKPTVDMWSDFHSAAWHTLELPGVDFHAGKVSFKREGGFLWLTLPSSRRLAYPTPAIENREVPWSDKRQPVWDREHKDVLTVLAFEAGRSLRYAFYPGLTFQHSVQATARDILAYGMLNAEQAGYPVIMSVHDEIIAELDKGHGDLGRFLTHLSVLPPWAAGLPLLADGWRGFRYRK